MKWEGRFIAECGSNHEGDLSRAMSLVRLAYEAGAHICKFQLWTDPEITARGNIPLSFDMFLSLHAYGKTLAKDSSFEVTASAFDFPSLEFLLSLKPTFVKFAYSKRDWKGGIEMALKNGAMPIVSTNLLDAHKITNEAIKLFCIPEYPVLYRIDFHGLSDCPAWKLINGFSDHTCGIHQAVSAAYTPRIYFIEKHIRLDHGTVPDHWFSIGKHELFTLLHTLGVASRHGEVKKIGENS